MSKTMPKSKTMSLADALALTGDARIVTRSTPPYSIVHTNRAWSEITGYKFTEVVGNTCAFLQGGKTVGPALKALHKALEARKPCHEVLINYRRDGTPRRVTDSCNPPPSQWPRVPTTGQGPGALLVRHARPPRTARGSCTGTSNPTTCCSRRRAWPRSPTSAWPSPARPGSA